MGIKSGRIYFSLAKETRRKWGEFIFHFISENWGQITVSMNISDICDLVPVSQSVMSNEEREAIAYV